ncbi:MAG TPA: MFS transporter [Steroidobacteraceae bacterium]|nr:MFS transporter [Steroidobacteraceae bacterium]
MKAGRKEWIGLAVLALPCVLYSMDLTVLNLAVPSISAALEPGAAELLWIVDIYGFLVAGSLITMGTLGDRIGRRRLLLIGAAVFGAASALAALAPTPAMLIATRALMGVAAATLAPSTLSLIRNMFHDPHERTVAISVWIMSYSAGAAIGPVIGGLLLEHFWWGSVFLINVPVMLVLLAIAPVLLPEFRDPGAGRLDLASAALSLAAILLVIYGLKHLAEGGGASLAAASIAAGIAIGVAFVRRQARLSDPLVDLRLFASPAFCAALAVNLLGFMTAFATFLFVAQYLQSVLGLDPLQAGLWGLPAALAFIAGSIVTPRIVRRFSAAQVIAGGMLVSAAGFVMLAQAGGAASPLAWLIVGQIVFSLGLTPVAALTTDIVLGAAPPARAGSAAALSETSAELGGALGIALMGSLLTALYRGNLAGAGTDGIPAESLESARTTIGAAVHASGNLAGEPGARLLELSRGAFADAFDATAWVSAAVAVAVAALAIRLLRAPDRAAG